MPLLALNDDVLLFVCSHLSPRDALSFSLTSKRAKELAIKRVASSATCSSPAQLRRLSKYMFAKLDGLPRAQYLTSLDIKGDTFREEHRDVLFDGDHYSDGTDSSQVEFIANLISHSPNLRELSFDDFRKCIRRFPKLKEAISSCNNLRSLSLNQVDSDSLLVLLSIPSDLKRLKIMLNLKFAFHFDDMPFKEENVFSSILGVISPFRSLHTLDIHSFMPSNAEALAEAFPILPSVRENGISSTESSNVFRSIKSPQLRSGCVQKPHSTEN